MNRVIRKGHTENLRNRRGKMEQVAERTKIDLYVPILSIDACRCFILGKINMDG